MAAGRLNPLEYTEATAPAAEARIDFHYHIPSVVKVADKLHCNSPAALWPRGATCQRDSLGAITVSAHNLAARHFEPHTRAYASDVPRANTHSNRP